MHGPPLLLPPSQSGIVLPLLPLPLSPLASSSDLPCSSLRRTNLISCFSSFLSLEEEGERGAEGRFRFWQEEEEEEGISHPSPPLLSQLIRHREEGRDRQALVRRIRRYIGSTDDEEIYSAILFHGHYSTVID